MVHRGSLGLVSQGIEADGERRQDDERSNAEHAGCGQPSVHVNPEDTSSTPGSRLRPGPRAGHHRRREKTPPRAEDATMMNPSSTGP